MAIRRSTDNTMAIRRSTDNTMAKQRKGQQTTSITLKTKDRSTRISLKARVNSCAPEG